MVQLDDSASVAFFPSDHYYSNESKFMGDPLPGSPDVFSNRLYRWEFIHIHEYNRVFQS